MNWQVRDMFPRIFAVIAMVMLIGCGQPTEDPVPAQRKSDLPLGGGPLGGGGAPTAVSTSGRFSGNGLVSTPLELSIAGASCTDPGSAMVSLNALGSGVCDTVVNTVAAGTGIGVATVSGTATVSANLAGGTCTTNQVGTSESSTGALSCSYPDPDAYTSAFGKYYTDWIGRFASSTINDNNVWECATSGGTCALQDNAGVAGRPGIQHVGMGSASGNSTRWLTSLGTFVFHSGDTYKARNVFGFPTTSSSTDGYAYWFGFSDTVGLNITNGCVVLYDERKAASAPATGSQAAAGVQELNCLCASAGAVTEYPMDGTTVSDAGFTTVATSVGAVTWSTSTNVLNTQVVVTGTSEVDFFVNGVKSCEITSHIPTTAVGNGMDGLRESAETALRFYDEDYTNVEWTLGSVRSP